jgi:hypothetical protein
LIADARAALSLLNPSRHRPSPSSLRTSEAGIVFARNGVRYESHHTDMPTQEVKPNEHHAVAWDVPKR